MKVLLIILSFFFGLAQLTKSQTISGKVLDNQGNPLVMVSVALENTIYFTKTDVAGDFKFENIPENTYNLMIFTYGFTKETKQIKVSEKSLELLITLVPLQFSLNEVVIKEQRFNNFGIDFLNAVEGTSIYASKKNEVIYLDNISANKSTNNSRQIYAKVSGINIWESDAAGLQLGIGGRGLNPNRTTNFNTRQNGYDISADALGYPESYYTPPTEALERIEVIRGAASLQYGTQFGGVVNFIMKKGDDKKPFESVIRQTVGSFGLLNTFVSVGGSKNGVNYYGFVQHKQGNGWQENSGFNSNTAYVQVSNQLNDKLSLGVEYTYMNYLAQQAGGLTDKQFNINPRLSYRNRNWFNVNWNLGAITLNYKLSEKTTINNKLFGLYSYRKALGDLSRIDRPDPLENRSLISGNFKNYGNELRVLHRYKLIKDLPSIFLIGTRYYRGNTTSRQGAANDGYNPDFNYLNDNNLLSDYVFTNDNFALFAENVFNISKKLSITPGARYEHIKTHAQGTYSADVIHPNTNQLLLEIDSSENKENARNIVLFGMGASYKTKHNVELYSNFSQNYRAINFSDIKIVNPNFRVDNNMTDESGWNSDVGVRGRIKKYIAFDLTAFCLKYNNRIGAVLKKDTLTYNTYRLRTNIGDARNIGLESFVEFDVLKAFLSDTIPYGFSLFSNIAYINATYISSLDPATKVGNKIEYAPTFNIKTGASLNYKKLKMTYQYSFVSEQFTEATNAVVAVSTAIDGQIPAYHVSDLSVNYSYKRYTLESGVNNLFNNMYFTRRATSYPGPGIIPSAGRSFYFTLQIKI